MKKIAIIGSGGFAKEIYDISTSIGFDVIGFIDTPSSKPLPQKIIGHESDLNLIVDKFGNFSVFIAIGNTMVRSALSKQIPSIFHQPVLLHSSANIFSSKVGQGSVFYPQSVVMSDCKIGENCIINAGATIGHDTTIGDFCNINPGANIAGKVKVGLNTTIGIGASIRENISIGDNVTVGAGTVVVKNLPDNTLCIGNSARIKHD